MAFSEKDIELIEPIGFIDDDTPVDMLKTYGGLYVAAKKNKDTKKDPEIIGYSSHPAILRYNLKKKYKFKEILVKNELLSPKSKAISYSADILNKKEIDSGLDVFIVEEDGQKNIFITKMGIAAKPFKTLEKGGSLIISVPQNINPFHKDIFNRLSYNLIKKEGYNAVVFSYI